MESSCDIANNSTSQRNLLSEALKPQMFHLGDDIEKFILQCERFFELNGIPKTLRGLAVVALIDPKSRNRYESIDQKTHKNYEDRLRKAFSKQKSFVKDMEDLLNYRRGTEMAEEFESKIDELVDKIMNYKWEREELKKIILINACNESEVKKTITMQNLQTSEEIIEVIKKLDLLKESTEPINAVRNYKQAVMSRPAQRSNLSVREGNWPQRRLQDNLPKLTCWNCNEPDHRSMNFPRRNNRQCYACGEIRYIRRFCTKMKCNRCGLRDHIDKNCFTSKDRIKRIKEDSRRREIKGEYRDKGQRFVNVTNSERKFRNEIYDYDEIEGELYNDRRSECNNTESPNGLAPTKVEVIGAVQKI